MYQYDGNHIEIDNHSCDFEFDICAVKEHNGKYIVLLEIPIPAKRSDVKKYDINDIYCLDGEANIVWRSQDLDVVYPDYKHYPYMNFEEVRDGFVYARDFMGCIYRINLETGKTESYTTGARQW